MPANSLLSVSDFSYQRNGRLLFKNLSVDLYAGESLFVQGANGSGKTTLLRRIAGIPVPLPAIIRHPCVTQGYVGHLNALKPGLTVLQNLQGQTGCPPEVWRQKLEKLRLGYFCDRKTGSLSAGQQRQVALARLILSNAVLWIADEPATHLDDAAKNRFWAQTRAHLGAGGIAVISSHGAVPFPDAKVLTLYG